MSGYAGLAKALLGKVGSGGYRPQDVHVRSGGEPLPTTVRELIACTPSDYDPNEVVGSIPTLRALRAMPARMIAGGLPVSTEDFGTQLCPAPHRKSWSGLPALVTWQPICKAFYAWLRMTSKNRLPDIDHPVDRPVESWDIIRRFDRELRRHGGWNIESLFSDQFFDECEPMNDAIFLPLYCLDTGGDDVPMIEFLDQVVNRFLHGNASEMQCSWPESVYESLEPDRPSAGESFDCLLAILAQRRFRLLPKVWAKACKALACWLGYEISFLDYEAVEFDFYEMTPDTMSHVFDLLIEIDRLRRGIHTLLMEYERDGAACFLSLIEHLNGVRRRHPELVYQQSVENL